MCVNVNASVFVCVCVYVFVCVCLSVCVRACTQESTGRKNKPQLGIEPMTLISLKFLPTWQASFPLLAANGHFPHRCHHLKKKKSCMSLSGFEVSPPHMDFNICPHTQVMQLTFIDQNISFT